MKPHHPQYSVSSVEQCSQERINKESVLGFTKNMNLGNEGKMKVNNTKLTGEQMTARWVTAWQRGNNKQMETFA